MQNEDRSSLRRLDTPTRMGSRHSSTGGRRSRSPSRRGDSPVLRHRSRQRSTQRDYGRLRELERDLDRQRQLLRAREDDIYRERSRLRQTVSNHREVSTTRSVNNEAQMLSPQTQDKERDGGSESKRRRLDDRNNCAQQKSNTESPTYTASDVVNMLKSFKQVPPQPSTATAPIHSNINNNNILPEFNPSAKNQRIDMWLRKVNECATVYGWDGRTTAHYAMQKLQGLAKSWYESLPSILFNWDEWQEKLSNAFPCDQNYGQSLEEMLKRRSRFNEQIEVYYYEKLALLNQCGIDGKRAVECIIHGLNDRTMRTSANALNCSQPEQLLKFLMSTKETFVQPFQRAQFRPKQSFENATISSNNANNNNNLTARENNPTTLRDV
ncbi:unnamed protein product [Plutella xylostella]|uniref:(diamondback moth) hypothetical protein n=1 Tax=Plutella xylostella TaxID=51655 RepID=A0A8S4GCV5_PLUXY|nr:unnamed protein product [Plutella xylostella]